MIPIFVNFSGNVININQITEFSEYEPDTGKRITFTLACGKKHDWKMSSYEFRQILDRAIDKQLTRMRTALCSDL